MTNLNQVPTANRVFASDKVFIFSSDNADPRKVSVTAFKEFASGMVYPSAGIAVSSGLGWETSIPDQSSNWNMAYSWGDHALAGYGDMDKATYDPTNVSADAFAMDNMTEGADTKILTAAERSAIAANSAKISATGTELEPSDIGVTVQAHSAVLDSTEAAFTLDHETTVGTAKGLFSTGVLTGGILSINADPTKFDISAGQGKVVNNYTDPTNPVLTPVPWASQTGLSVTHLAVSDESYVGIDSGGNVVQSQTEFTDEERRDIMVLGSLGHLSRTSLEYVINEQAYTSEVYCQMEDFFEHFGPFNIEGNEFYANGANLNVSKSAGKTFDPHSNYATSKKSPNIISTSLKSQCWLQYYYRDAVHTDPWIFGDYDQTVDPSNYDDGSGTLAPVTASYWTNQRIFYYAPLDSDDFDVDVQYGQEEYATSALALAALNNEFAVNPFLGSNTYRGTLTVKQGATDLSDPAQAIFTPAGKFGLVSITAGGGAGGGETNTASNAGVTGVGLVEPKVGVDLPFRSITAGSSKLSVALDAPNKTVKVDLGTVTTANVSDSTDKRYVTDAQLTVISNTSGTNTGDYSHPNHTGDVTSTGDGAQVIAATAISGKASKVVTGAEELLINDAGTLKKATAQSIADLGGGTAAPLPTYTYIMPSTSVGANKRFFDMFNAVGSGKIMKITSVRPIVDTDVALTGSLGIRLLLFRTSTVGTGGTLWNYKSATLDVAGGTCSPQDTTNADPPAGVTARHLSTGGSTASEWLRGMYVMGEEASTSMAYHFQGQHNMLDLSDGAQLLVIREGEGIHVRQGAVAATGNVRFRVTFTLEDA